MSEPQDQTQTGDRLQRVLAARGVASRRKSEDLIREGRVTVNGKVVTELGTRVDRNASIKVDGKVVRRWDDVKVAVHADEVLEAVNGL